MTGLVKYLSRDVSAVIATMSFLISSPVADCDLPSGTLTG
jgi:hypothetical protein